jgi:hypothetical protein
MTAVSQAPFAHHWCPGKPPSGDKPLAEDGLPARSAQELFRRISHLYRKSVPGSMCLQKLTSIIGPLGVVVYGGIGIRAIRSTLNPGTDQYHHRSKIEHFFSGDPSHLLIYSKLLFQTTCRANWSNWPITAIKEVLERDLTLRRWPQGVVRGAGL